MKKLIFTLALVLPISAIASDPASFMLMQPQANTTNSILLDQNNPELYQGQDLNMAQPTRREKGAAYLLGIDNEVPEQYQKEPLIIIK